MSFNHWFLLLCSSLPRRYSAYARFISSSSTAERVSQSLHCCVIFLDSLFSVIVF